MIVKASLDYYRLTFNLAVLFVFAKINFKVNSYKNALQADLSLIITFSNALPTSTGRD